MQKILGSYRLLLTGGSGVDFDDPDFGFKEEDKDEQKVSASIRFTAAPTNTCSSRLRMSLPLKPLSRTAMVSMEQCKKQSKSLANHDSRLLDQYHPTRVN